jgi:2-oxoacid:acceptor oxidoreductase delta subunit (pyruvate/2-ketoisovalerate family)
MRHVEALKTLPLQLLGERSMAENHTGNWRSQRPVIDGAKCTGCQICWKFCPEACVTLTAKVPVISMDYCKGCAVCAAECPKDCIAMVAEESAS